MKKSNFIKENLRNVTPLENKQNKGFYKNNKSGYKYIYFDNNKNMYIIQRRKDNKQILIGSYKTLLEAITIRNNFLKKDKCLKWLFKIKILLYQ